MKISNSAVNSSSTGRNTDNTFAEKRSAAFMPPGPCNSLLNIGT